jgi:hypothetical protein
LKHGWTSILNKSWASKYWPLKLWLKWLITKIYTALRLHLSFSGFFPHKSCDTQNRDFRRRYWSAVTLLLEYIKNLNSRTPTCLQCFADVWSCEPSVHSALAHSNPDSNTKINICECASGLLIGCPISLECSSSLVLAALYICNFDQVPVDSHAVTDLRFMKLDRDYCLGKFETVLRARFGNIVPINVISAV